MKVESLHIYPVKSLRGISVKEAELTPKGLKYDRSWMLVDEKGKFISQRTIPQMALLNTRIEKKDLHVSSENEQILIPLDMRSDNEILTSIWKDKVVSAEVSSEISEWFSDVLGKKCKLVSYVKGHERIRELDDLPWKTPVSYADGYPFLLIGTESLNDLNRRLENPVFMDRFRPNIVVKTVTAYTEDSWSSIQIGDGEFLMIKPCVRCVMTTINQQSAAVGEEPLKTLSQYRKVNGGIHFGVNACLRFGEIIKVGDLVKV
jgi:uncharacterized protein YcbX